ncbi:MAG TPA: Mov34/MPN/PAD-1 family protein, partial [Candidatus Dormibacteraeota bacterium]|nr:Mov34/MPN/PAD-1 family protein [Candidatus Dormibacteraeota bacterium]
MAVENALWISSHLAEKIRAHGAKTYPHECCGALLGRDSDGLNRDAVRRVLALFPLVNRHRESPRNRFIV